MTQTSLAEVTLRVPGDHHMLALLGERDAFLRVVEEAYPEAAIVARGDELRITGTPAAIAMVKTTLEELLVLVRADQTLDLDRVRRVIDLVKAEVPSPSDVFTDGVPVGRGKVVRAKTLNQKRYVDAIRQNTVVFGIAEKLAERVGGEPTDEARIHKAYREIFGRTATAAEIQAGREFLLTEPMKQYEERKAEAEKAKAKLLADPKAAPAPEPAEASGPSDEREMVMGMMAGVTPRKGEGEVKKTPARLPITIFGRYLKVLLSSNEFLFVS